MAHTRNHLYKLTGRETEVLECKAQTLTNREISEQLGVGIETVRMHAKNIYTKLLE